MTTTAIESRHVFACWGCDQPVAVIEHSGIFRLVNAEPSATTSGWLISEDGRICPRAVPAGSETPAHASHWARCPAYKSRRDLRDEAIQWSFRGAPA